MEHEFVGLAAELSVAAIRNIPRPAAYSVDSFLVGQVIEAWWIGKFWQFNISFDKELSTAQKNHTQPQQSGTSSPCWSCTVVGVASHSSTSIFASQPAWLCLLCCSPSTAKLMNHAFKKMRLGLLGGHSIHSIPKLCRFLRNWPCCAGLSVVFLGSRIHIWYVKVSGVIYTPNCHCDAHWSGFTIV